MIYEYRLMFTAPLHLGIEGIGQERIEERGRSDTLWGAIIQQWLQLYPQEDPERLCLESPFAVSSCFPLIKGVPFYPLPLGAFDQHLQRTAGNDRQISFKDLKKLRFVSKDIFCDLIRGNGLLLANIRPDTAYPLPHEPFPEYGEQAAASYFSVQQRPRLRIDQLSGGAADGAFFYCADQHFNSKKESGLFFLASFANEEMQRRFEAALRLLGDTGLGGDRSVGRGTFTASQGKAADLPMSDSPNAYLLLSLYHPTKEEVGQGILSAPDTAYSLTRRSGHAASPAVSSFRRSDIWMIEEGAVMRQEPSGDVVCVLERSAMIPHNVYRYGRAFSLPVHIQGLFSGDTQ